MLIISTIWHTGTNSLIDMLGLDPALKTIEWDQIHCSAETVELAKEHEVHTTYRDPFEVAVSWANRGLVHRAPGRIDMRWYHQWRYWGMTKAVVHAMDELPKRLNSEPDILGLYQTLKDKDWEAYYSHIPKLWVPFATEVRRNKWLGR